MPTPVIPSEHLPVAGPMLAKVARELGFTTRDVLNLKNACPEDYTSLKEIAADPTYTTGLV